MKVSLRRRAACNGNSDKKHKTFTFSFSLLPWPAQPLFRVYEAAVIRNAMMGNCAILFIQKLVGGHAKIAHEACCYLCHCHSIYTDHVTDSEPQSTESADSPFPHARLSKYFNSGSAPSNRCGDCSDDDGGQDTLPQSPSIHPQQLLYKNWLSLHLAGACMASPPPRPPRRHPRPPLIAFCDRKKSNFAARPPSRAGPIRDSGSKSHFL